MEGINSLIDFLWSHQCQVLSDRKGRVWAECPREQAAADGSVWKPYTILSSQSRKQSSVWDREVFHWGSEEEAEGPWGSPRSRFSPSGSFWVLLIALDPVLLHVAPEQKYRPMWPLAALLASRCCFQCLPLLPLEKNKIFSAFYLLLCCTHFDSQE